LDVSVFKPFKIALHKFSRDLEVGQQAQIYTKGRLGPMSIINFEEIHTKKQLERF
jgi:hypothetical protein